jgi:hypothetical protein
VCASWVRCGCLQLKPLPLASQGGSATRNDERLGHRLLRLRCAPAFDSGQRHPPESERARAREAQLHQPASRERSSFSRSPLRRLTLVWPTKKRASATHLGPRGFTPRCANENASESGHVKRSFTSPPVASAQTIHLGPRGFTPRGANENASESGHVKRSFTSPPVASAQTTISAPEDSLRGAPTKASESGHVKRSFTSPQVASAQVPLA